MSNSHKFSSESQADDQSRQASWKFRLYVAGQSVRSLTAIRNLNAICEKYLFNKAQIELIDLLENPQLAAADQIVAVPTLIRISPLPLKVLVGDLSKTSNTLDFLGIQSVLDDE